MTSLNDVQEQVEWAIDEGADFIVAETFGEFGEAKLALESIKNVKKGNRNALTRAAHCVRP